ncbi:hypothetical protein PF002_g16134 [Phytophthora fragariae]|uniref:Uncharacterized protein n=1 Tax=Phytophthora fragariae TaxID=53985 RepID=A0A6A3E797_9STRA|nr:hypothetical protein PF009_g21523 [Phytophthora fragariae]KAE9085101.1 hypothetical protein PF006_g26330 [Phytophthora fragariae]KAE9219600.1 hypothetical protein PF002_g16134 [Phytophthora fragariae]KAE9291907.1 hypothetical protein PF001_g18948 [Phytophthora fragariae]
MWRELRKQGWTRKPPPRRELDDRYFYLRPGGDASVTDGVDFFRGEEAVLEYYATVYNEDGDDLDSSADSALSIGATSGRESDPGDEDIKVSALGNEMLADNNDDLNTDDIETGEFDSDEDMEPQCAPDDDHDDPEEAKLEVTAEVLFAENLLVSLVAKM